MAKYYNCDKSSVLNHAKKIGFDPKTIDRVYKLTEKDKAKIISLYGEKTSQELANEFCVSRGMITKLWKDNDLKGKKRIHCHKYDLSGEKIWNLTVLYKTENRDENGNVMWMCKCDCGNYKEISSHNLKNKKIKSCGCLSKDSLKQGRKPGSDLSGKTFGNLLVLNRCEDKVYKNELHHVQWLCRCSCGRITKITRSNLVTGNSQSCGFCRNNSHGNTKISKLLDSHKIHYQREKRFQTCRDKQMLPFDFFVEKTYCIEYDGRQHFDEKAKFYSYDVTHKHDEIKNKWCVENNIPLIRIPYTHYNDLKIEDLLIETTSYLIK